MKVQNTLLKKILLLFIVLLVPLILLSSFVLNYSNKILKEQVLSSIDANNLTHISLLDNTLYNIYKTNFNMVNQSSFGTFANLFSSFSPYEKKYRVGLLREQLSSIEISNSFIARIHVYFKDLKVTFTSPGYKLGSFSSLSEEDLTHLEEIEHTPGPLHYYQNSLTGEWELAYLLLPTSGNSYGVRIVLSQQELETYLRTNTAYPGEQYLFTSGTDFTLTDFNSEHFKDALTFQDELSTRTTLSSPVTIGSKKYYAFYYNLPHTSSVYIRFIPTNTLLKSTNTGTLLLILFLSLVFVTCIIYFIEMYRLIHRPLLQLTSAFSKVEEGDFTAEITDFQNADFAYLYKAFNNMTCKLDQLIEKDYTQKLLLQKAELKQLQAQINPHFLYNSFFMLQRMIKTECMDEAQQMSNALGIYFRYLTRNSMDQVSLAEEYEHAKTYAYIQGLRFSGRIQIVFEEIPSSFMKLPVPKLILQPILENAFNYGLANKVSDGLLQIHFIPADDVLTIMIEENGEELTDKQLQHLENQLESIRESSSDYEMSGILNIQRRLIVFSNSHDSLQVSRSHLGGLCVSITLRKNIEEDHSYAFTHCR